MSDIFSLNGCYLKDDIVSTCGQDNLATAKTLLGTGSVGAKISGEIGSYTIAEGDKVAVRNALSVIQAKTDANIANLNEKNTKRSIQINTYYAKKHTAKNYILKVVYIMVLLVAIMWAIQTYTDIIPEWILSAGMAITIAVCSIIIIFKSIDISSRSTFDYDQKITSIKNLPPLGTQDSLYTPEQQANSQYSSSFGKHCQDSACCPKFYSFNPSLGYCSFNPFS